jgi:hypothetical protein
VQAAERAACWLQCVTLLKGVAEVGKCTRWHRGLHATTSASDCEPVSAVPPCALARSEKIVVIGP